MKNDKNISIIIPAKNESDSLTSLLPLLADDFPDFEIILVNDGSDDNTNEICEKHGVKTISHAYSKGNGAAIKSGARAASGDTLVFMDADGQHSPSIIKSLIEKYEQGYDMIIGARDAESQASVARLIANTIYNKLASYMVNHKVLDLTSGMRVVNAEKFREFLNLYPNGFSYPATSTMAFYRAGYNVGYLPIKTNNRIGKSHIKIVRDGIRFLLILFKIGTLYSPLKIFLPISSLFFMTGVSYYIFTYITTARFTNMSALLLTTSIIIFLIGLVSEQITMLLYQKK
jgi:glycosyltransferase involved in cell wall biosynthesis